MDDIQQVITKIRLKQYELSKHALDQSIMRDISVLEIEELFFFTPEIIEDYPNDKYGASSLILGYTVNNRPLHVQCSYSTRPLIKIITLYQPDPDLWINDKHRRVKE